MVIRVTEDFSETPDGAEMWEYRASKGPMRKQVTHSIMIEP